VRPGPPDEPRYQTTLGPVFYRQGQYSAAAETLLAADRLAPNQPATVAFLALAQHHLGQVAETQSTLARLREALKTPAFANEQVLRDLLTEAEVAIKAE
jgi:predicted Zn-dependent protease